MSNDLRAVLLLNPQMELPEFGFFPVVKVKMTKVVGDGSQNVAFDDG